MKKFLLAIIILTIVLLLGLIGYTRYCAYAGCGKKSVVSSPVVTNFKECVAAGNAVMKTYPAKCAANGQTFVEEVPEKKALSGIEGRAMLGPSCPVVRKPNSTECDDKPYKTSLNLKSTAGKLVQTFETDVDGFFRVDVDPGDYVILSTNTTLTPPTLIPVSVSVHKDEHAKANLKFDTGIR